MGKMCSWFDSLMNIPLPFRAESIWFGPFSTSIGNLTESSVHEFFSWLHIPLRNFNVSYFIYKNNGLFREHYRPGNLSVPSVAWISIIRVNRSTFQRRSRQKLRGRDCCWWPHAKNRIPLDLKCMNAACITLVGRCPSSMCPTRSHVCVLPPHGAKHSGRSLVRWHCHRCRRRRACKTWGANAPTE